MVSPDGDLVGRDTELLEEVSARDVERGREEVDLELIGVRLQLLVLLGAELEEFPVLAIGGTETILVVVRLVERRSRIQPAVIAFLQFDRMGAGQFGLAKQLTRLSEAALVIVPDLRDHIARRVIADLVPADAECPWQIDLLTQGLKPGARFRFARPAATGRPAGPIRTRRAQCPARRARYARSVPHQATDHIVQCR